MNDKKNKSNRPFLYYWIVAVVLFIVIRYALNPIAAKDGAKEVSYSQFVSMIEKDQVTEVYKDETKYTFKAKVDGEEKTYETGLWVDTDLTDRLLEAKNRNDKLTFGKKIETTTVSYTHLTLPTILLV